VKSEKQITEKMEKTVESLVATCDGIEDGCEATEEQKAEVLTYLSTVGALAWVLDQEEEMRPILTQIRLAGVAQKLEKQAAAKKKK